MGHFFLAISSPIETIEEGKAVKDQMINKEAA